MVPDIEISKEIIEILIKLSELDRKKVIEYICNILNERYDYWERMMGDDL